MFVGDLDNFVTFKLEIKVKVKVTKVKVTIKAEEQPLETCPAYNKHVVAAGLLVLAALLKVDEKLLCLLLVLSKIVFYLIIARV